MKKYVLFIALVLLILDANAASRKLGSGYFERGEHGPLPPTPIRTTDADCGIGEICRGHTCKKQTCHSNNECSLTETCVEQQCQEIMCTPSQFIEDRTCKSCDERWSRGCECVTCNSTGCTAADRNCYINEEGFAEPKVCSADEYLDDGECVKCSSEMVGCDRCTGKNQCTRCSDGSDPIDGLCVKVECLSSSDCSYTETCINPGTADAECVPPPSIKDPSLDCQETNGEYADNHVCNSCPTGCKICNSRSNVTDALVTLSNGQPMCSECEIGYYEPDYAGVCEPASCRSFGLSGGCGLSKISIPYNGDLLNQLNGLVCYTCENPSDHLNCTNGGVLELETTGFKTSTWKCVD